MKNNRLLLLLLSLLGLCVFLFTFFYQEAKREAIYNLNVQQSLHARQAARGIQDFFNHWTGILTVLSKWRHIIDLDQTGREALDSFYQANREQVRGITRVDANGRIVYTIPYDRNLIGRDISFQNHVQEVMRTRKPRSRCLHRRSGVPDRCAPCACLRERDLPGNDCRHD